ncbi:MAG: cadherin-like beta sandwich domain-containing protein, partial [Spirochaetia bacterium]
DYRIAVRRDIGIDSVVLSELAMLGGTLAPAFDPQVTTYTISVAADVDVVRISATPLDQTVELSVGNRPYPARPAIIDILLYEGVTVKTPITLRAPNGLERVYTIAVNRPAIPSRIGRRILEVTMDELRLSRMVASSLNTTRANLDADAIIRVRYHGEEEVVYEDFARITTEKAQQDVLISMSYRSGFIDVDLGRYLDIEVAIPTSADRYLHYNTVAFADGSLDIRPDFLTLSDRPRMDWPQAGIPRPVAAQVLYQVSAEARNRMAELGDAFRVSDQGEFEITLELTDLSTGRSLGSEVLPAKPASVHGRAIEFANGIELPEGAKIGYVLTARTVDDRLLRAHGAIEVRTLETFENGEWEYASLFVEAVLELIEGPGGE